MSSTLEPHVLTETYIKHILPKNGPYSYGHEQWMKHI